MAEQMLPTGYRTDAARRAHAELMRAVPQAETLTIPADDQLHVLMGFLQQQLGGIQCLVQTECAQMRGQVILNLQSLLTQQSNHIGDLNARIARLESEKEYQRGRADKLISENEELRNEARTLRAQLLTAVETPRPPPRKRQRKAPVEVNPTTPLSAVLPRDPVAPGSPEIA